MAKNIVIVLLGLSVFYSLSLYWDREDRWLFCRERLYCNPGEKWCFTETGLFQRAFTPVDYVWEGPREPKK